MAPRTVKLLHVEDDPMQQRLTAQQLTTLPEFRFDITNAQNEDDAVAAFRTRGPELVILDYHLAQGNGLSCLHKLRQEDRIVPIIALSGQATQEIAAELLRVGADDYLSKKDLATEDLARSVRDALARADAWRRVAQSSESGRVQGQAAGLFDALCQGFAASNAGLIKQLDAFEAAARETKLTVSQMQTLFESVCSAEGAEQGDLRRLLRPLLLEIILRLFGDETGPGDGAS